MRPGRFLLILVLGVGFTFACGKGGEEGTGGDPVTPRGAAAEPGKSSPEKSPEDREFEHLVSLFESNDFGGAVRSASDFARMHPESPRLPQVLYLSGRASVSRGDFDEAIATLDRMRERFPDDENMPFVDFYAAQALYLKAHRPVIEHQITAEAALPAYEKALDAFRETAEKHRGDAEVRTRARLMMAQLLTDMGQRKEALEMFQAYMEAEPNGKYTDQVLFQVGDILMDLERFDEAAEAFKRLTVEFPGTSNSGSAIDRIREISLIGESMPPIQGARWMGNTQAPDYAGKVVLVVFWNTNCSHCQREMPKLEGVYRNLRARGLAVIGLTSNDQKQNDASVNAFIEKYGITFPVGIETGSTANAYAVSRIPAVAIVDRKGIVRWRNSGDLVTESLIERFL